MTRMKFTAENIAAILIASTTCGSYREVIESSGTDLAPSTLHGWISRGNRDIKNNKDTAWAVFVTEWNSSHIKLPNDSEIKRMAEVNRALEMVEVARASGKPDGRAIGKPDGKIIVKPSSRKTCECGQSKAASAVSCPSCQQLDLPTRRL